MKTKLPWAVSVLVTAAPTSVTGLGGPGGPMSDGPGLPVDQKAETALLASLGGGFRLTRSDHFVLATDLDDGRNTAPQLLATAEAVYAGVLDFCRTYHLQPQTPRRRLELVCFADARDFDAMARARSVAPVFADGFYDYRSKRAYFVNRPRGGPAARRAAPTRRGAPATGNGTRAAPNAPPTGGPTSEHAAPRPDPPNGHGNGAIRDDASSVLVRQAWRMVVRHETAHLVLDAVAPALARTAPEWLAEGLACAFETGASRTDHAWRVINVWRLADAAAVGERLRRTDFADMIRDGSAFGGDDRDGRSPAYARAWLIVAFLDSQKPDEFGRYMRRLTVAAGAPRAPDPAQVFDHILGRPDRRLNDRIAEYARRCWQDTRLPPQSPP